MNVPLLGTTDRPTKTNPQRTTPRATDDKYRDFRAILGTSPAVNPAQSPSLPRLPFQRLNLAQNLLGILDSREVDLCGKRIRHALFCLSRVAGFILRYSQVVQVERVLGSAVHSVTKLRDRQGRIVLLHVDPAECVNDGRIVGRLLLAHLRPLQGFIDIPAAFAAQPS